MPRGAKPRISLFGSVLGLGLGVAGAVTYLVVYHIKPLELELKSLSENLTTAVAGIRADREADIQMFNSDRQADIRMLTGLVLSMKASQSNPLKSVES